MFLHILADHVKNQTIRHRVKRLRETISRYIWYRIKRNIMYCDLWRPLFENDKQPIQGPWPASKNKILILYVAEVNLTQFSINFKTWTLVKNFHVFWMISIIVNLLKLWVVRIFSTNTNLVMCSPLNSLGCRVRLRKDSLMELAIFWNLSILNCIGKNKEKQQIVLHQNPYKDHSHSKWSKKDFKPLEKLESFLFCYVVKNEQIFVFIQMFRTLQLHLEVLVSVLKDYYNN